MSIINRKNIGAFLRFAYVGLTGATAAGTGDNTLVNGASIDLQANGYPLSMAVAFPFKTTLASAATLSLAYNVQHSSDNGNWSDLSSSYNVATSVISTGGSGGSTNTGVVQLNVDLSGAKRYIRVAYTPDLSATGTDTANIMPVVVFGGMPELP